MNDVNINVTQAVNFIGEFSKRHRIIATLSAISAALIIWWTFIQIINYYANVVYPDKIYLSLWETGKKVPINDFTSEIPPITPIKPNEPVTLRFVLTQNNTNSPQITSILLTFPDEAKVEPIPYEGWSWVRNNDIANRYFLNFSTAQIIAKGADCNLPAFSVTFKRAGQLAFSYQIISNKIKPIHRKFIINTELKYEEELARRQNYWLNESPPRDTFKTTILSNGIDVGTASPSMVSGSVVMFDPPIAFSYSDNNEDSGDTLNKSKKH